MNATLSDISEAYKQHRPCFIDVDTGDRLYLSHCNYESDSSCEIHFTSVIDSNEAVGAYIVSIVFYNSTEGDYAERIVNQNE